MVRRALDNRAPSRYDRQPCSPGPELTGEDDRRSACPVVSCPGARPRGPGGLHRRPQRRDVHEDTAPRRRAGQAAVVGEVVIEALAGGLTVPRFQGHAVTVDGGLGGRVAAEQRPHGVGERGRHDDLDTGLTRKGSRCRTGHLTASMPTSPRTVSNASVNCPARSRTRNRKSAVRSPRSIKRLRICCVVHRPSGLAVTPRTCT